MICKFCNAEIEDGIAVCPICGKELAKEAPVEATVEDVKPENPGKGKAIAGLILSIISVILANPIGFVLAIISLVLTGKAKKLNGKNNAMTIIATILGILGIVFSIMGTISMIFSIIYAVTNGMFAMLSVFLGLASGM